MESDVAGCTQMLTITSHRKRLVAEGGEGRKSPKNTDEGEGAQLGREQLPGISEARERPDQKTAQQIDG